MDPRIRKTGFHLVPTSDRDIDWLKVCVPQIPSNNGSNIFNIASLQVGKPLTPKISKEVLTIAWPDAVKAAEDLGEKIQEMPTDLNEVTSAQLTTVMYYSRKHLQSLVGSPE